MYDKDWALKVEFEWTGRFECDCNCNLQDWFLHDSNNYGYCTYSKLHASYWNFFGHGLETLKRTEE